MSYMDGSRDCHTEWRKSDRKGELLYDIPYMWNLERNDTNKLIYKIEQIHRLKRLNLWLPGEGWGWDS